MAVVAGITTTWALKTEYGRLIYSSGVVQSGLIMNLDFSKGICYPARFTGSTTTAYDLTDGSINGTLIGDPTFTTQNGGYFSFNGTSQYIKAPIPQANLADQTVQLWINLQNLTQTRPIFGFGSSSFGPWFLQLTDPTTLIDYNFSNGSNTELKYFNRPATTGWKFISVVKGSTVDAIVYENTSSLSAVGFANGPPEITNQNFTFISAAPVPTLFANDPPQFGAHSIAHVMVYNRKLNLTEITQNFNVTKSRFGL